MTDQQFVAIPQEDINRVNGADLRELADPYTELHPCTKGGKELEGPCPKCGGTDRFHVLQDWFFCRQCYPPDNGQAHDAIGFVRWLQNCDFRAAYERLNGQTLAAPTEKRKPEQHSSDTWKAERWQKDARQTLTRAQDTLWNLPEGKPGRQYLERRGIRPDVWLAWDLGFWWTWHPQRKTELPAIWLPWQNRQISAIQYRFIGDDIAKTERFGQKAGGDRLLYGLHLRGIEPAHTLILCEGELNAVSLWQVCYAVHPVDVVSWGPKDNIQRAQVSGLAGKVAKSYKRVIVWADEPADAVKALRAVGAVEALRSPDGMDANDLLQRGWLENIVAELVGEPVKVAA